MGPSVADSVQVVAGSHFGVEEAVQSSVGCLVAGSNCLALTVLIGLAHWSVTSCLQVCCLADVAQHLEDCVVALEVI